MKPIILQPGPQAWLSSSILSTYPLLVAIHFWTEWGRRKKEEKDNGA